MSKPKPIPADPTRDGYQVVVSFRFHPRDGEPDDAWLATMVPEMLNAYLHEWEFSDLSVEIDAAGEQSQMEGAVP